MSDQPLDHERLHRLHRTIMIVRKDFEELRFNTAIARRMELTSHATKLAADNPGLPRAMAEPLVLMVAPLAPHIAEELWTRLGHGQSLTYAAFPEADLHSNQMRSTEQQQASDPEHARGVGETRQNIRSRASWTTTLVSRL